MGCCNAKEQDVVQPGNENNVTPNKQKRSSSESSNGAPKKGGLFGSGKKMFEKKSKKPSEPAPPPNSIPADGPQAPPPGWGGTPEVEEEEDEYSADRSSGPRDINDIAGEHGYISGTRKDHEISNAVKDKIKTLEKLGVKTKKKMDRKMLTPRIITDVKETWDKEGNITRYMTHYVEDPDGRKYTKKETVHIAAGEPDPLAASE